MSEYRASASPKSGGYSKVSLLSPPTSRPCTEPPHSCRRLAVTAPHVPPRYLTHPSRRQSLRHRAEPSAATAGPPRRTPLGNIRRRHPARTPDAQYPLPDIRKKFPARKVSAAAAARGWGEGKSGESGKGGGKDEGLRGGRIAVGPPAGSFPPHAKSVGTDADFGRQSGRGLPTAALGFPVDGVDRPDIRRRREHYPGVGLR